MISSTIEDMKEERNAAADLITSHAFEVLRSETHAALGLSSREICERMATDCDIFIGILGNCYGSAIESEDRSITEMEFDTAKSVDPKKILIYLKEEADCDENDDKQKAFRRKVEEFETGYFRHKKYKSTDELVGYITQDLAAWIAERVLSGKTLRMEVELLKIELEYKDRALRVLKERSGLSV